MVAPAGAEGSSAAQREFSFDTPIASIRLVDR